MELKQLKDLQIKKRQKEIYEKELELLKDKQKDIYNDFICDYDIKRDELELNYQKKMEIINNKYNNEKKEFNDRNLKKEQKLINKKIVILEDKFKKLCKMKLFKEAEKIRIEIENEKKLLNNQKKLEKIKINKIRNNNLNNKQIKRVNKINLNYNRQKNDLEISFNKEKNELFQKFKNQLNDFEMFKNKNNKYLDNKYLVNNNDYLFNQSFDKDKLGKKLEDEEESIEDYKQ
jgi:hypothetical protein